MIISVKKYEESERTLWNDFCNKCNNGTIFHNQSFFDYHPTGRFNNHHLIFRSGKKIVALLTGAIVENQESGKIYVSHQGASYGGFVLPMDSGIKEAFALVAALIKYLKQLDIHIFRITPPPLFYMKLPHQHIEFALMKSGATVLKSELTSIVHLKSTISETLDGFRSTARTSFRKAQKEGVIVCFNDRWEEFYSLLEKNLGMRHGVKPTHTLDELLKLRDLFPDKILLLSSFYEDVMIAGVTIFVCNPESLLAFYISHINDYQHLRPLNILFYELFKWGIENHYRLMDFGTFTLNMEPIFGLGNFKEGFGAGGVFRTTWQMVF
jgi:hypothetical protein